jgi:hypothetical protein
MHSKHSLNIPASVLAKVATFWIKGEFLMFQGSKHSTTAQCMSGDEGAHVVQGGVRWQGMEWLFLNAKGNHPEASSVLSNMILSGDATGDAAKLLGPSADPKGLPLRAALLRKATVLYRMRKNAAADDAAAANVVLAHSTGLFLLNSDPMWVLLCILMRVSVAMLWWSCA